MNFEITDRSLFLSKAEAQFGAGIVEYDYQEEGDAYALEDLLRLVQLGDDRCINRDHIEFFNDEDLIIWGLSYLSETTLGRAMAFDARFEDWALEVDDMGATPPALDPQLRILILPRGTPSLHALSQTPHYRHEFLTNLARGLRMIWQEMNGVRARQDISCDDQILWERLRRADQDVIMLHMAWELRDVDGGNMWRHLIAGDTSDVVTLAAGMWSEDDSLSLASSLLNIFTLWLTNDELLNQTDAITLDEMDARLHRSISAMCGRYFITPEDVMALGRLPDAGSYLTPIARTLLYAEDARRMPDSILEAHLHHIIADCGFVLMPQLMFSDTALQEKIFPNFRLDTLA